MQFRLIQYCRMAFLICQRKFSIAGRKKAEKLHCEMRIDDVVNYARFSHA